MSDKQYNDTKWVVPVRKWQAGDEIEPNVILSQHAADKLNASILEWWEREGKQIFATLDMQQQPMSHSYTIEDEEFREIRAKLRNVHTCPICGMPKTHHRLYGYRCNNPEHN